MLSRQFSSWGAGVGGCRGALICSICPFLAINAPLHPTATHWFRATNMKSLNRGGRWCENQDKLTPPHHKWRCSRYLILWGHWELKVYYIILAKDFKEDNAEVGCTLPGSDNACSFLLLPSPSIPPGITAPTLDISLKLMLWSNFSIHVISKLMSSSDFFAELQTPNCRRDTSTWMVKTKTPLFLWLSLTWLIRMTTTVTVTESLSCACTVLSLHMYHFNPYRVTCVLSIPMLQMKELNTERLNDLH